MATILRKVLFVGGIGVGSFYCGTYYNKNTLDKSVLNGIQKFFDLPFFTSVSAATPFSPVPQNRVSQIMKYGFPSLDNVRSFDDYVLSYDRRTRVAHWVFEHITKESIKYNEAVDRSLCNFTPDESIHPYFRLVVLQNRF